MKCFQIVPFENKTKMKWYKFLIKQQDSRNTGISLSENETIEKQNLVVCHKLKNIQFGKFENYLHFVNFMLRETPKEKRCFYELISGSSPQKPYFDIEFYVSESISEPSVIDHQLTLPVNQADESIEEMLKLIQEEIPPLSTNRSHIFVFTSHKESKRSYHIVVEGFCFSDHKSNKLFSEKIKSKMSEKWKGIIDSSMYKSSQQFRIAGCCKFDSGRFKTLHEGLTINGYGRRGWVPKIEPESEDHKLLLLIESSLVTQTSGSILLPSLLDEKEENSSFLRSGERKEYAEFFEPLTSENIKEALTLCHKLAGMEYGDPRFPYGYMRTIEDNGESSIILLKRRCPSMCRICNRPHEHENPFLLIIGLERDIYLDCRRNDHGKKLYVGKLGLTEKAKALESSENKPVVGLPSIPGVPSVNLNSLMQDLSRVSQAVAPKIKEKPVINKTGLPNLNFSLYKK